MPAYKILSQTLVISIILIISGGIGLAADGIKIGVIDSDRLISETAVGKNAKSIFMGELTATRKILTQKQKQIKILRDSLVISKQIKDKPESIKKQEAKLGAEINEYQQIEALLKERLHQQDIAIARRLRKSINQVVKQHFIEKENYCLILEKQDTVAMCGGLDITDELIQILNAMPPPENPTKKSTEGQPETQDDD